MVRKVIEQVPDGQVKDDLEKYRQRALELGATDAKIITADMIVIDERVRAKCLFPVCNVYGSTIFCPPHGITLDFMRKVLEKYRYAIFTKMEIPSENIAGLEAQKKLAFAPYQRENWKRVAKIETEAFADGYYQAMGFANASCKLIFCPDKQCAALETGKQCRFASVARSSMEAVGMDCFSMAAKVGWDVYPIGRSTSPLSTPYGVALGLVLIY